jgi:intracellular sulfur oxidation DsrE/DsrF family protein
MSEQTPTLLVPRRSFLTQVAAGVTVAGSTLAAGDALAQAPASRAGNWQPTRHAQDEWMDQLPGKHRFVFDTTSADGIGAALLYATNFFVGNQSGYGLTDADAAVVIVARHNSTPYAYNDVIWAKYGAQLAARTGLNDPVTKRPPTVNLFNTTADGLPSLGTTVDSLIKRGAHFAVCQMATRFFAGQLAQAGGSADAVYNEIAANLVGNAHLVAAGIVAVNRAQERGYTLATAV